MNPILAKFFKDVGQVDLSTELKLDDAWPYYSYSDERCKLKVKKEGKGKFWPIYCAAADKSELDKRGINNINLAESPLSDQLPLMLEFHLQYDMNEFTITKRRATKTNDKGEILKKSPKKSPERGMVDKAYISDRVFSNHFITQIIYDIQQFILENCIVSADKKELICVLLSQSKKAVIENTASETLRFQFPFCVIDRKYQETNLRNEILFRIKQRDYAKHFTVQPSVPWEMVVRQALWTEPIAMYGSTYTSPGYGLYKEKIYGEISKKQYKNKSAVPDSDADIASLFLNHLARKKFFKEELTSEFMADIRSNMDHYMPLLMSIYYSKDYTPTRLIPAHSLKQEVTTISGTIVEETVETDTNSPKYIAAQMMKCISIKRADEETSWIDIGKALWNAYNGDRVGLAKWMTFTGKGRTFRKADCMGKYYSFNTNKTITYKTLGWYAFLDNEGGEYTRWHKEWVESAISESINGLEADVALALYRKFWLEYSCSDLKNNQFYYFNRNIHKWTFLNDAHTLRNEVSTTFIRCYAETLERLKVSAETKGDSKSAAEDRAIKKTEILISNLKKRNFKRNVILEAAEKFYDSDFNRNLDRNDMLFGCSDAIIELTEDSAYARDGKPEDFIYQCSSVPYIRYSECKDSVVMRKLQKWLICVFPEFDLREYFLKMSASCLRGKNLDKIFPILTGSGNNSKSMIVKLFESTFGGYCVKLPTSLFTGKRGNSGAAAPEIVRAEKARVAFLQEPAEDEQINTGLLKEFSGGDTLFARGLFKEGGDITPQFTVFLMCNKIPTIPSGGKAIKNRTLVLPFSSTWAKDAPESEEEQLRKRIFKLDPAFEKQIPELAIPFLSLLVEYYPKYRAEGLKIPKSAYNATQSYWDENDMYANFVAECITKVFLPDGSIDDTAALTQSEVFRRFKTWHKDMYPSVPTPGVNLAQDEFKRVLGDKVGGKWHGYKIAEELVF
jgi:P4 family phage/plasmid primase-like protien